MKYAVVTIAIGDKYKKIAEISHPTIKAYAEKCGADFICWEDLNGHSIPHYRKLDIGDLLNSYDRILYLDTDVIVRDDAPDLFAELPMGQFAAFNEFNFTNHAVGAMSAYYPSKDWIDSQKYFNTGVFMCDKSHKDIFAKPEKEIPNFFEQTHLNYMIHITGAVTFELRHRLNRMSCMDLITGEQRHDSFFLHYAGYPDGQEGVTPLYDMMKADLAIWESGEREFQRHLYFEVDGGLGDVVATEPVIRKMCEDLYHSDDVVINTEFPEVFSHIPVKVNKNGNKLNDIGYRRFHSMPRNVGPISHGLCHPTDFASLQMFRGQLAQEDKQIILDTHGHKLNPIQENILKKSILIHPGKGWESKTFPATWWQRVVELIARDENVVLIGRKINDRQGVVEFDTSSVTLNLIDQLDLRTLFRAIELAPVLISNDSSPIHIAGAFDNWIGLIDSCKPAFRILPHRKGRQDYKAQSLAEGNIELNYDPCSPYDIRMDIATEEQLSEILPSPQKVALWAIGKFRDKI